MVGRDQLTAFILHNQNPGTFLLIFAIAGIFPISALAYQIFQRETQLEELQRDFALLGFIRRDPQAGVSVDILRRYNRTYNPWHFAIHSTLVVLITMLGLGLFFWPPGTGPNDLVDMNTLQAMRYGFVGAYVFSIQLIYRRYTTLDLQLTVYLNCVLTLIAGLVFNYVAFETISNVSSSAGNSSPTTGAEAGIAAIVAFSLGYFPYLAIGWFNRLAHGALGARQRRSDQLQLGLIDGISQLHETRLRDEGIDNIQNLASVQIDELLLKTRFTAQQVIEWVDQAVLYLYLEPSEIDSFRRGGVRTINNFQAYWESCSVERVTKGNRNQGLGSVVNIPDELREARQSQAQQLQSTCEHLDILYRTTLFGPNMAYIENYWKNTKDLAQETQQSVLEVRKAEDKRLILEMSKFMYNVSPDLADERVQSAAAELASLIPSGTGFDRLVDEQEISPDAMVRLAWVASNARDYDSAIKIYKRVIEQYPDHALARNDLAWFYADTLRRSEHLAEALRLAEEGVRLGREQELSDLPSYLDTLATVKIRMAENETDIGKKQILLDEAKAHLQEAERAGDKLEPASKTAVEVHLKEIEALRSQL
jgi:tetratricopeptide (TPR) repeat protein